MPAKKMTPLIICGYQKSGTTLLPALLDGHSMVMVIPEETSFFQTVVNRPVVSRDETLRFLLEQTHLERLSHPVIEASTGGNRDYRGFDFTTFRSQLSDRFMASDGSHRALLECLVDTFASVTGQTAKGLWVEKTPRNELFLGRIESWYPDVRTIYMVRDPRDVYVSHARLRSLGQRELSPWEFASNWALSLWSWQSHSRSNDRTLLVRYEDLLSAPEAWLRIICGFLGIRFEDALLQPTKLGSPWHGNSLHGDTFSGISTKPIGRWQTQLRKEDRFVIESLLGKAMVGLGYQVPSPTPVRKVFRRWVTSCPSKKKVAGALFRLYWPFELPGLIQNRHQTSTAKDLHESPQSPLPDDQRGRFS